MSSPVDQVTGVERSASRSHVVGLGSESSSIVGRVQHGRAYGINWSAKQNFPLRGASLVVSATVVALAAAATTTTDAPRSTRRRTRLHRDRPPVSPVDDDNAAAAPWSGNADSSLIAKR
jgi:hypothetical protein